MYTVQVHKHERYSWTCRLLFFSLIFCYHHVCCQLTYIVADLAPNSDRRSRPLPLIYYSYMNQLLLAHAQCVIGRVRWVRVKFPAAFNLKTRLRGQYRLSSGCSGWGERDDRCDCQCLLWCADMPSEDETVTSFGRVCCHPHQDS
jgi:hypothetical protein